MKNLPLSQRRTEGDLPSTEMDPDISDDAICVSQDVNARISQNSKPQSRQFKVSHCIFLSHPRLEVLTSVDLNDNHLRWATKVNNVVADRLLPVELNAL